MLSLLLYLFYFLAKFNLDDFICWYRTVLNVERKLFDYLLWFSPCCDISFICQSKHLECFYSNEITWITAPLSSLPAVWWTLDFWTKSYNHSIDLSRKIPGNDPCQRLNSPALKVEFLAKYYKLSSNRNKI